MALDVKVLEDSFAKVVPVAGEFADGFFENFWLDNPEAKALFENIDMEVQKNALINSLVFIVKNLTNESSLVRFLRQMGKRHVSYGALPEHYEIFGDSLLKTLSQFLGEDWNDEVKQTWLSAYQFISMTMIEAAEELNAEAAGESSAIPNEEELQSQESEPVIEDNVVEMPGHAPMNIESNVDLPEDLVNIIRAKARDDVREAIQKVYDREVDRELEEYGNGSRQPERRKFA